MAANVDHDVVKRFQPSDGRMKIWRYVDLPKLIDLLETGSLHFARAETLGDPFEGTITRLNVVATEQLIQEITAKVDVEQTSEELRQLFKQGSLIGRQTIYINCWHGGETESAAMWRLYGTGAGSIVLQSTYKKLANALPDEAYMGMVQYKDYSSLDDWIPGRNIFYPFIHKRKEFEYEKEVRAFIWNALDSRGKYTLRLVDNRPDGIKTEIDIDEVVETIRVQPTTPPWIKSAIERLLERYGWGVKVMPSQIDLKPMY